MSRLNPPIKVSRNLPSGRTGNVLLNFALFSQLFRG
jgi:hypothetical protein